MDLEAIFVEVRTFCDGTVRRHFEGDDDTSRRNIDGFSGVSNQIWR
jgi:hypothetical protein